MKYMFALLADIANGLFATLAAGWLTSTDLLWWHFLFGILFAMSPDVDGVIELLRHRRFAADAAHPYDHRELMHFPVLFLILGALCAYLVPFWGTIFLIAVSLHFLNDFYGTGWGIRLLWPLTSRQYKLLGRRANLMKQILVNEGLWDALPTDERRLRIIVSWSRAELPEYIQVYGRSNWIDLYYRGLNWVNGVEYTLFLIALTLTILTLL